MSFNYQGMAIKDLDESNIPGIQQDIYETSDTAKGKLGTIRRVGDRIYRYCKAGAVALVAGKLTVFPTPAANHQNVAVAAAVAVNATTITVTLGATAATANQYADGVIVISDATGEGTMYTIKSHPAAAASATLTLTLYDKVHTALDTTSECCLIPNLWNGTVISITDQADIPAGVPLVAVTASYYYWSQTGGLCPVLSDETVAQGQRLTIGSSTAGSVEADDAAGEPEVGKAIMALVDTEYRPIWLTIDR